VKIEVPYGRSNQCCTIPDNIDVIFGKLKQVHSEETAEVHVNAALKNLIGNIDLDKLIHSNSVAIAVSDITRPVPSRVILESLISWLNEYGITEEKITLIIGGGLHRPANRQDLDYILGDEILAKINKIEAHDADNFEMLQFLGESSNGTPVYVNKHFTQADFKIVTGMVDAHQFMGFTAGVKGAVIGLGGRPTITGNHALLFNEGAELGRLEGNPARADLEDIGQIIGVDMIVNVVLNDKKQVIKAVAGHPVVAHQQAVEFAKQILGVEIKTADIVITSPGGFPKDINVYQAQKALTPASQIVKNGGTIILVAECLEGSGEESFVKEMSSYQSPKEILDSYTSKPFIIGPHKAYLWARALLKARVILVSQIVDPEFAKLLMVEHRPTLQEAIDASICDTSDLLTVTVLPYASSVIPIIKQ